MSIQVRFAVLKVLQELYVKLGEEFMVLLPETIPFLAECMEGVFIVIITEYGFAVTY